MENIQVKLGIKSTNEIAIPNGNPRCIKLDLGCGDKKRNDFPGFIGIDSYPHPCVDIVRDIEKQGLPFGDYTIDFIYASHFMEHIGDLIFVMEEIWRVLKRNGILELICPKWDTQYATGHPDHKRLIHPFLWDYWRPDKKMDRESYGIKAQFRVLQNYCEGEGVFTTLMAIKNG